MKAGNLEEVPGHPVKRESAQTGDSALTEAKNEAFEMPEVEVLTGPAVDTLMNRLRAENPRITESREICENLISDWRLQAALDLEKVRYPR